MLLEPPVPFGTAGSKGGVLHFHGAQYTMKQGSEGGDFSTPGRKNRLPGSIMCQFPGSGWQHTYPGSQRIVPGSIEKVELMERTRLGLCNQIILFLNRGGL
jgi:hypothetical protein